MACEREHSREAFFMQSLPLTPIDAVDAIEESEPSHSCDYLRKAAQRFLVVRGADKSINCCRLLHASRSLVQILAIKKKRCPCPSFSSNHFTRLRASLGCELHRSRFHFRKRSFACGFVLKCRVYSCALE